MRARALIVGTLFAVLFFASLSYSGVPQMINYQGKLTTPAGALMDTTIQMVFTIYDAATDGGILWTETQPSVVVEKGIFSVLLGNIPYSVFDGSIRYLGVKVGDDDEMEPRKPIVSVGYAFHSGTAQSAEFADTAQYAHTAPAMADADWVINGDTIYHVPGNVGIGTSSPETKLHVQDGALCVKDGVVVQTVEGGEVKLGSHASLKYTPVDAYHRFLSLRNHAWWGTIEFVVKDHNGNDHYLFIDRSGNVGIDATSPAQKLDVAGTAQMTGFKMPTGAGLGKILTSDASGVGTWQAAPGGISGSGTANYIPRFLGSTTLGNSVIYETGGNVGIATTSPGTNKLKVAGNIDATGLTEGGSNTLSNDISGNAATATNADKMDGYHAGNASGQVAISNSTKCTDLNADMVDGYHGGNLARMNYAGLGGGGGTTTITFPHTNSFLVILGEKHASPNANGVGFVHCIENDAVIAWHGFDGDGNQVRGSASLWGVTTVVTVRAGNIKLETPGDGSRTLKLTSASEMCGVRIFW